MDPGRRAHYAEFYDPADDHPVAVVWGNCQAEAIRVLLDGSPTFPLPAVRVPPVHELELSDMAPLQALLPRISMLITQPVRAGYRNLALGTDEVVLALAKGATVVRWPVIRYAGLHPFSVIVRHRTDPSADPPVVPYHDLRTISLAAGRGRRGAPSADALRSVAAASIAELARREEQTDVGVSDLLLPLGARAVHTINHPHNEVLIRLARRLQTALGCPPDADDPGRELLGRVRSPLEPPVVAALALDADPQECWQVDGATVDPAEIEAAQLRWYDGNRSCIDEGLRRYADRMAILGL